MKARLVGIAFSKRAGKKWDALFEDVRTGYRWGVPFGAKGYKDYTEHGDPGRKRSYLARHQPREQWDNPFTPGALSRWILWNFPTLEESLADYRRRFNL